MSNRLRVAACALLLTASSFAGTIIHVPANQPTIQAGINAASNGDTVLVAPGTYYENINFIGKAITVKSSSGTKVTIIDGSQNGPVVMFNHSEGNGSVLSGFTIQNGVTLNIPSGGGGIAIQVASPIIKSNVITNNTGCTGIGIGINGGSPIVQNNVITKNKQTTCTGGGGGGINISGSNAQILNNVISNNTLPDTSGGGGIVLLAPGTVLIQGNLIIGNVASGGSGSYGGGIDANDAFSNLSIVQNVIVGNHALTGGGIAWSNPVTAIVDNTIANNDAPNGGSAVFSDGFYKTLAFENNILVAAQGQSALLCANNDVVAPSLFASNDVYSSGGAAYAGTCTDHTGKYGNISSDPIFVNSKANNYRLKGGSPAIDSGNNLAPQLTSKDFAGNPRIINGNDLATAIVDIGAYEFVPVVLAPKSLGFGLQAVGSTTSKTVKLTNAQNKLLNVSSYTVPTGYSVSGCGSSIAAFTSCTLTIMFHPLTSGTFKGSLVVNDDAGNSPQTVPLSGSAH